MLKKNHNAAMVKIILVFCMTIQPSIKDMKWQYCTFMYTRYREEKLSSVVHSESILSNLKISFVQMSAGLFQTDRSNISVFSQFTD